MADGPIIGVAQFDLITGDAAIPTRPVATRITYDPCDPYAVRLFFILGRGKRSAWVVSRELLAEGLRVQSGAGDFRLGPRAGHPGCIQVTLSSPSGVAHFAVSSGELDAFLQRTYAVVPRGTERDRIDVDAAIAAILEETRRG